MRTRPTSTTSRQRQVILGRLRDDLGDRLFADFLIHALSENPMVSVGRYPSLAALWLRGRVRGVAQKASAEEEDEPWSA